MADRDKTWEVVLGYLVGPEYCETRTLFFEQFEGGGDFPAKELASGFAEFWVPDISAGQSSAVTLLSVYARCLEPFFRIPHLLAISTAGQRSSPCCPPAVGVCITQYAKPLAFANNPLRRSTSFAGIAEADQELGILGGSAFSLWNTMAMQYTNNLRWSLGTGWVFHACCFQLSSQTSETTDVAVVRPNLTVKHSRRRKPGVLI